MSLHRLFWIPEGAHPRDGVYVTYPAEEMYALLSCESHRHHTEIVGEDLGTVPPGVRTRMRSHALARTWIYVWSLRPRAALMTAAVPPDSLATLGTHDMVPLAGFWRATISRSGSRRDSWRPKRRTGSPPGEAAWWTVSPPAFGPRKQAQAGQRPSSPGPWPIWEGALPGWYW